MARPILCTYFTIILPTIAAESGSGAPGACEHSTDAELDISFSCITQFPRFQENILVCHITRTDIDLNEADVGFTIGRDSRACSVDSHLEIRCSVDNTELLDTVKVCLNVVLMNLTSEHCQELKATDIVKPEAPFGLNITYQEEANEYLVKFLTPHKKGSYLHEKFIHQVTYCQENKACTSKETDYLNLKLQRKELQPDAMYEIKVRSKPNGFFFKGTWSEWSPSQYIRTAARSRMSDVINVDDDNLAMIVTSTVSFFVLLIILSVILIFWKTRIKPIVWPTLPNPEKTLDKLCNKLRKNSDTSFFNPESLGYVHVHKVDSIQAKSEMNPFQQSLLHLDEDLLETTGNGLHEKNDLIHINNGRLKLSLPYEGMWPGEMLNRWLGRSNPTHGDTTISGSLYDESSGGSWRSCNSALSTHSHSSVVPILLPGSMANPSCPAYTVSRLSNKEEAYVTMASFLESKGNGA